VKELFEGRIGESRLADDLLDHLPTLVGGCECES
jgi:hypothetical protein